MLNVCNLPTARVSEPLKLSELSLIALGGLRVGNPEFSDFFSEKLPTAYRLVHQVARETAPFCAWRGRAACENARVRPVT
eukprot:3032348-Rhodomonas_salina.1